MNCYHENSWICCGCNILPPFCEGVVVVVVVISLLWSLALNWLSSFKTLMIKFLVELLKINWIVFFKILYGAAVTHFRTPCPKKMVTSSRKEVNKMIWFLWQKVRLVLLYSMKLIRNKSIFLFELFSIILTIF